MGLMFRQCSREDQYIVQVYDRVPAMRVKYPMHHPHKRGRCVFESEWDDFVLVEPIQGNECCLVAVIWVYPYLVVPARQIQLGEDSSTMELIQ